MQLICEAYDLLHRGLGLTADDLHRVFTDWNKGELDSYLIEYQVISSPRKTRMGNRSSIRSLILPDRRVLVSGRYSAHSI